MERTTLYNHNKQLQLELENLKRQLARLENMAVNPQSVSSRAGSGGGGTTIIETEGGSMPVTNVPVSGINVIYFTEEVYEINVAALNPLSVLFTKQGGDLALEEISVEVTEAIYGANENTFIRIESMDTVFFDDDVDLSIADGTIYSKRVDYDLKSGDYIKLQYSKGGAIPRGKLKITLTIKRSM